MSVFDQLRHGPEERAAQQRLDDVQASGQRLTVEEAEALSDAVWAARDRDRAPRNNDEERER